MPALISGRFHSSVNDLKGSLESLPREIFMPLETPASGTAVEPRTVPQIEPLRLLREPPRPAVSISAKMVQPI
jgi:hypothetical protein